MAKKKKNATRKLFVFILVLVVLIVIIGAIISATGILGSGERATKVEIETVSIRSITQIVTASGKIQPEIEVNISPDVSGEIIALPVKEGDAVRRGQLLASIQRDYYEAQQEQADASVLQSRANEAQRRADYLNAELEAARQKQLFDGGAISDSEYQQALLRLEMSKAALEAAQYSVQIAQARLSEASKQLSKTNIYAPMDGTISIMNVELGERVVGTTQFAGTEMMRVAKLDQMELLVDVNENDVVNVSVGDTASVEIDSYPDRIFKGIVTEIANSARTTGQGTQEQVTNFPVKIRILDAHNVSMRSSGADDVVSNTEIPMESSETPKFRPGMSGTVDVFTRTIGEAIAVPIQAVTVRDLNQVRKDAERKAQRESGYKRDSSGDESSAAEDSTQTDTIPDEEDLQRVVFLMIDGHAKLFVVETGISDDSHVVILSGVSEGETVIIGPYRAVSRTLKPDDLVEEQKEDLRND